MIITGTPGTGKSSLCEQLVQRLGADRVQHVNLGEFAKEQRLLDEYDAAADCHVLDEDRVIDALLPLVQATAKTLLFDYHGCDFLPEEWVRAVFVLRTENGVLFDRLERRGYAQAKIEENVQCEIFQTILDEAREAFDAEIVFELPSNGAQDLADNLEKVAALLGDCDGDDDCDSAGQSPAADRADQL